jgi:predicted O-linked N-acetylglucosamine transferase (SPINDLY family)
LKKKKRNNKTNNSKMIAPTVSMLQFQSEDLKEYEAAKRQWKRKQQNINPQTTGTITRESQKSEVQRRIGLIGSQQSKKDG